MRFLQIAINIMAVMRNFLCLSYFFPFDLQILETVTPVFISLNCMFFQISFYSAFILSEIGIILAYCI